MNILLSDVTGVSSEVAPFCSLYPEDINGDSITEVPHPVSDPAGGEEEDGSSAAASTGTPSASDGTGTLVLQTYHNVEDGWYLRLPESWTARWPLSRTTGTDESTVTFSYRDDEAGSPGFPADHQAHRLQPGDPGHPGRADHPPPPAGDHLHGGASGSQRGWAYGLTEDELREAFNLITTEWTTSDS